MNLISYDSSDESEDELEPSIAANPTSVPAKSNLKRKALPALPDVYESKNPRDDPALHQGRKRTRPFVDGDYDAHIYISLTVSKAVQKVLDRIMQRTREMCPELSLNSLLQDPKLAATNARPGPRPLHISLTHPFPLRRSQIDSFRNELQHRLEQLSNATVTPFRLSFAGGIKIYYNGRRTGGQGEGGRAFLAFQVGAGHAEIDRLVEEVVHPMLKNLHLPLYHANPEYHASFAWCLLDRSASSSEQVSPRDADSKEGSTGDSPQPIKDEVVAKLDKEFREEFSHCQPQGGWRVDHVELKIGKDIRSLHLGTT